MLFPKHKKYASSSSSQKKRTRKVFHFINKKKFQYLVKVFRKRHESFEEKERAIFMANKQIYESTSDILKAAPIRALERLRHCLLCIASDILKIPPPTTIDDEIPSFCKAFQKTLTLQQMMEASLKMLPEPSVIMNMGIADIIELLCFGSIRDLVAKHYTKFLSSNHPSEKFTVPAFLKEMTDSYSKISEFHTASTRPYTPIPVPNQVLYPIETLIHFADNKPKNSFQSFSIPELFISKFMKMQSKTIYVHPFQILVIDIVSFIVNSIQVDLSTANKVVSYTLSSLSEFLI